jgi:hypothetical protein
MATKFEDLACLSSDGFKYAFAYWPTITVHLNLGGFANTII